jgi:glycosyltransferase involved in cell wall biosynthesis
MDEKYFNLVLVNSFSQDEPFHLALEAVANLTDVHLYVTGDTEKLNPAIQKKAPPNVTFTGFLAEEKYLELLRGADAVMVLTVEDFTLQLGGMEAVAVGKPLIVSDFEFLRDYFSKGSVFTPNTAHGIENSIIRLKHNIENLSSEILELRKDHQTNWDRISQNLHEDIFYL